MSDHKKLYVLNLSFNFYSKYKIVWSTETDVSWVHPQNVGFKTSGFKMSGFKTSETSGLQNVRFTKRQVFKTSGCKKKHPYIFCTCGWWKSAGSVAAMFAGKVMRFFCLISP
jgi:hypothetical protein